MARSGDASVPQARKRRHRSRFARAAVRPPGGRGRRSLASAGMPRSAPLAALPLGVLLAAAIAACGSGGSSDRAATLTPPPAPTETTAPAATGTTTASTAVTTTTAPGATTTGTSTAPSSRSSGGATTTEPSGGAPAGCPSAVGGFIRDVRATDCSVARTVANAWFDAVHAGARPDGTIQAAGYSCDATMSGERASVACSAAAGGSVAFTASP
jgi:hypothetical protein